MFLHIMKPSSTEVHNKSMNQVYELAEGNKTLIVPLWRGGFHGIRIANAVF